MDPAVRIQVLLFAAAREAVGEASLPVELPSPATGAALLDALCERYPALARQRPSLRLAANQRYIEPRTLLREGDEVALIPPVSGG